MRKNRRAMVSSGHQRDRRPEGDHALQMRALVANALGEDRSKHVIGADGLVEAMRQLAQDVTWSPVSAMRRRIIAGRAEITASSGSAASGRSGWAFF